MARTSWNHGDGDTSLQELVYSFGLSTRLMLTWLLYIPPKVGVGISRGESGELFAIFDLSCHSLEDTISLAA